ncbi:MAG: hypothetical protein KatS3mg111_2968 [Pirellulaceae bacterium]|nr:MAG: hypothetical protein KatS3mg111_2968 [Pirellulaceae bacterium]
MVRAVGAREGAEVPLPLDLVEMGLPEGLTGTVLSIQQCPQPPPGPGRLVLTTVNHLNRDVIELDLRASDGKLETLRPTGNHKFYSVTRNAWLSAAELVEGEQLDGVGRPGHGRAQAHPPRHPPRLQPHRPGRTPLPRRHQRRAGA